MFGQYTLLVWDFNGTLLDDAKIGLDTVNNMLVRRSLPQVPSLEEYRTQFGFPIIDFYRRIGFDFSRESYNDVALEWADEYTKMSANARPMPRAQSILSGIKDTGLDQVLLSATQLDMLVHQTKTLGIFVYFSHLYGLDDFQANGKEALAEKVASRNKNKKILFIGDTEHDAAVAKRVHADCVLVACGHQSREKLEATGCPVFDGIKEAIDHLNDKKLLKKYL